MGYHFGVGWLQGGFFSLDIFYVLSGYLITGLLLERVPQAGPASSSSAFWLRRARRLLPALVIVLVAVTLLVRFAEPPASTPTSG